MDLVIVESPSKANTIEKYLGSDYRVLSSVGHIRDLATSGFGGFGVDVENNYKPTYKIISGKQKIVKELTKASQKASTIFLATDPDREGEAISYHLFETLGLSNDNTKRVVFNEITKNAVKKGIENPRAIDYDMVHSQETRRIIDRIIGFRLSKILWKKIKSKSAGRVQSVALLLICDLEDEIQAFKPEEYYEIYLHEARGIDFKLEKYKNRKLKIATKAQADKILESLDKNFEVTSIDKKTRRSSCSVAFITSTLQQTASRLLGFSAKKTMSIAQKLYEGINIGTETTGLITYMRSDSTRLAGEFLTSVKSFINENYGKNYYKGYHIKNNKNAQDAHEAIRPTNILLTPEKVKPYLKRDEFRLYSLIYNRALASNMKDALYEETIYNVLNNDYLFTAKAKIMTFDGYTKVYDDSEKAVSMLKLAKKEHLDIKEIEAKQLFTKAPSRYTEAKLIKKLESLGIGRPSTYATIIETLKLRYYVEIKEKKFYPTEQGMLTVKELKEFFSDVVNVKYTAKMEKDLDAISTGGIDYVKVIDKFYHPFMELCDYADKNMPKLPPKEVGMTCPECGSPLVERIGRYGKFIACSNYPECKYVYREKKPEPKKTGLKCPNCGRELVVRVATRGRNKGNEFYACSGYPKCKFATSDEKVIKKLEKLTEAELEALKAGKVKAKPSKTKKTKSRTKKTSKKK